VLLAGTDSIEREEMIEGERDSKDRLQVLREELFEDFIMPGEAKQSASDALRGRDVARTVLGHFSRME
jgi:hypothetical protein